MTTPQHRTRISAGKFKHHVLRQPGAGTRPVSQKIRAAIFDVIGHELTGLSVLDLYAGSGALGLEAVSRGATSLIAVDKSHVAIQTIQQNFDSMSVMAQTQESDVEAWLKTNTSTFDLIFFDPPYDLFSLEIAGLAYTKLNQSGILVVSCASGQELPPKLGTASLVKSRTYDNTLIGYFQNNL